MDFTYLEYNLTILTASFIIFSLAIKNEVNAKYIEFKKYIVDHSQDIINKTKKIKIIKDDFITTDEIKESSIDLIITSPPYNIDIQYNSHKDNLTYEQYLEFTEKWLTKAFSLAKNDGRLCLNIPLDKNKGGQQSVYSDILQIAKKCGWRYHSTIIWNEGNISRRTAWGSYMSASAPYVIAPVEVIIIMYKTVWKKENKGKSNITKKEFIDWTNGLWTFQGESKKKIGHPTPFPIELPSRCIKLFSYKKDFILDPFLGSGTTLIACIMNKRKGFGVEIDEEYCKIAKNRLIKLFEENSQTKLC